MALIDLDAFIERSAILQFDADMSRFEAETAAAKAQGEPRHEFINALRNLGKARDQGPQPERNAENDMPEVQSDEAQKAGSMPERDVHAGCGASSLLALWMVDWGAA